MKIVRYPLATSSETRRAIYGGDVFLLAPTEASLSFVSAAREELVTTLGTTDVRAVASADDAQAFAALGRVRRTVYLEPRFHELSRAMMASVGLDPLETAFDPARLRVIEHRGHDNPRAAPVYYPHRDTWYAHPPAVITCWTALDDLDEHETFVFHPERWDTPVANDSEIFDYDAWVKDGWGLKIGWQDREAGRTARYPGVVGEVDAGLALGFSCRAGEVLLFSGAHFHRTLPQATGRTRYSLDLRAVHLGDHALGLGAPNVDGRSRGSALVDYVRPSR